MGAIYRAEGPPASVLAAFGVSEPARPLPAGQGRSWRADRLVLKPVPAPEEETQAWLHRVVRPALRDAGLRIALPVLAADGAVVVEGWAATEWVDGEHPVGRWAERVDVAYRCTQALAGIDPSTMPRRDDPWARADRAAWGESSEAPLGDHRLARVAGQVPGGEQVVHGDLAGNVLMHPELPPAVIDLSLYARPPQWPMAVLAVDLVAFSGAPVSLFEQISTDSRFAHLLARALLFRMTADVLLGRTLHPAYQPVVDAVLERIGGDAATRRRQVRGATGDRHNRAG